MSSISNTNLFDQLSHGYRIDREFGAVYDRTPSAADDLTEIRGVDTREAVILNRLGVYFFPQIALWSRHEAGAFADELGMNSSTLIDEQWIQQASLLSKPKAVAPRPSAQLPASVLRTVSLLACSLIVGCLIVYWLGIRSNYPLSGILSADITSMRVPADSRLLQAHVNAGDEVFSGDPLLTLEKSEHLTIIRNQEKRVLELSQQLERAKAQADLDLEWRTRELEREISDVRTRAHLFKEVSVPLPEPLRASRSPETTGQFSTVSNTRDRQTQTRVAMVNPMIFVAGQTGQSSFDLPRPKSVPSPAPPRRIVHASEPGTDSLLTIEARAVESRLKRLEELRTILPEQVRRAAGVESVRLQYQEATQRLEQFQSCSREVHIKSPAYGKVGLIRYETGDTMSPGEIMLKILHTDRRYILMYVPSRRINEVELGMDVSLIFPGSETFRGKVANLPMLADATGQGDQSVIPVRVKPTGRLWPEIPIGSEIDIFINGETLF